VRKRASSGAGFLQRNDATGYQTALWDFRADLRSHGLDICGETTQVAALAQVWATLPRQHNGRQLAQ
jgi:hypothetical protein